jgi:DNA-binding YbaB/EbfC family protein
MPDMQALMQQAQQMQEQLLAAQEELADAEVTGSAGGGLVTATVSGSGELRKLDLDRTVVDPDDTETLSDLIVAAVRDANHNASGLAEEKLGPLAGGLGGGLGDLGTMLGGGPGGPAIPGA